MNALAKHKVRFHTFFACPILLTGLISSKTENDPKRDSYGGQAVIEGVLMRSKSHLALALRRKSGEIERVQRKIKSRFSKVLISVPFLRGFFILLDMLTYGLWALNYSQKRYIEDNGGVTGKENKFLTILLSIISITIALGVFKILPSALTEFISVYIYPLGNAGLNNAVEAVIRFGIFVGYVWGIGLLPEVQNVFRYHGAEHAVINAYEDDPTDLSAETVAQKSRLHPRCGTSFITYLVVTGMFIYYFLDKALMDAGVPSPSGWPVWWVRLPIRILAIPLLAGFSYELIRVTFMLRKVFFVRFILYFGMLFQLLTTRTPTPREAEVAVCALLGVVNPIEKTE